MNLKFVVAFSLFATLPMAAQSQNAQKPTKADVQKVVQMIGGDKAKLQAFCDIGKVQDQMQQADEKKDTKALEALGQKADALSKEIGPDYVKLLDGLDLVDPNSPEGKDYDAMFATLAKQCK
jgi:hypothetical protein